MNNSKLTANPGYEKPQIVSYCEVELAASIQAQGSVTITPPP